LLSCSLPLTLEPLTDGAVATVVRHGMESERGLAGAFTMEQPARPAGPLAGGDARRALTHPKPPPRPPTARARRITLSLLELAADRAAVRYDRQGDQHYDVISAFIKPVRGSDVDAALHYSRG
jgi:putative ATPase